MERCHRRFFPILCSNGHLVVGFLSKRSILSNPSDLLRNVPDCYIHNHRVTRFYNCLSSRDRESDTRMRHRGRLAIGQETIRCKYGYNTH